MALINGDEVAFLRLRLRYLCWSVLLMLLICPVAAGAQFQNGSFELGSLPPHGGATLPAGSTAITGWVVLSSNIDWIDFVGDAVASNGTWFLDLNGTQTGGIQQTFDTIAGTTYTVTFDMKANTSDLSLSPKSLQVSAAGASHVFTYVPSFTNSGGPWQTQTFTFTATAAQTTLAFHSLVEESNIGPLLDNVTVVSVGQTLQNGSFELGNVPPHGGATLQAGSTAITGWVVLASDIDWIDFVGNATASNGTWFLDLNGTQTGGIEQTLGTVPGMTYAVAFDMNANTSDLSLSAKSMQVSAGGTSQIFTYVPTITNSGGPWQTQTFTFTATVAQTTLDFQSLVQNSSLGPLLDNVTVVVAGHGQLSFTVFRPVNGTWYILPNGSAPAFVQWGLPGDIPVSGDYDGDGQVDFAVWRPSTGVWYIIPSSSSGTLIVQQWGLPGDVPVSGDFDRDGKSDLAVWRPSNGTWYVIPSSDPAVPLVQQWGLPNDVPVVGDYDGDGKADFAVWRPSNGVWYVIPSSSPGTPVVQQWGLPGDLPVPGDFDRDRKTDFAVWRPSNGTWYVTPSSNPSGTIIQQWGLPGDLPLARDFDDDGKTDLTVWRPSTGTWYIIPSGSPGAPIEQQWGLPGDIPISRPPQ